MQETKSLLASLSLQLIMFIIKPEIYSVMSCLYSSKLMFEISRSISQRDKGASTLA